jgi:ATP-dependent Clp protease ATP-binding subunit ClpA
MARLIQEKIKKPLANDLLFGKLAGGGNVTVSVENNELRFAIESAERPVSEDS